ncbi:glycosyltransferase family 2 protein [Paenibacillus sp. YYML68]|uniref:glycosyltransferase family 2 protein n=1 Tax=Paenibacillus sp. YYML68 TaxID=2909250 RepID=UPI0024938332|nr:glycosyltransferase family 2 protein [Paenibacillus sp. YYML68]
MRHKVVVQIVTFNSELYIYDCILSVLKQTYPIEEIIIIDNASSDNTLEIVSGFGDKVVVVTNTHNVGFAAGHNQAIRMVMSDYHVVLNPDVIMHPEYISHCIKCMQQSESIGSATGKLLLKNNPSIVDSTGLRITKSRRVFDRGSGESVDRWTTSGQVFGVSGAAAIYSRLMIDDVSINGCFYDEDFFAYKEDVDIAWRSNLFGWKAYYCADATAFHVRGWKTGERKKIPLHIRKFSYINRYKMLLKNEKIKYLLKDFIAILMYECASFLYLLIKEPLVLSAWLDLVKKFSRIWEERSMIQDKLKINPEELYDFIDS